MDFWGAVKFGLENVPFVGDAVRAAERQFGVPTAAEEIAQQAETVTTGPLVEAFDFVRTALVVAGLFFAWRIVREVKR